MNIKEIMASVVQMLHPGETLVAAARVMKDFDIGCVFARELIEEISRPVHHELVEKA